MFFCPQFDLKSLTGKSLRLPTKESAEEAVEGRLVYDGTAAKEACVLAMTKEMEYSHIVPLFPTGDDGRDTAKWLVGKPFTAGFTVAAAATLKAEMSQGAAAAAAKAQAQADEGEGKKGGKAKGRAKRAPKMTAVQEYGVGIHDAVLGEETDRNRSVAEVPLESLWTRWTAVGGHKRSREEQEQQQQQLAEQARAAAAAAEKAGKKGRKEKEEAAAEEEEEAVQEPEKKRSRKGTKKHGK